MAKIEATVEANIGPFQKKLKEATESAREFGKGLGEVGVDLGKNLTGLDIGKMLKIGGAIVAAKALGDALVDAAKEGMRGFAELEQRGFQFGEIIKNQAGGREIAENIEAMPGHMGDKGEANQAMVSLLESFAGFPDQADRAKAKLLEFLNVSAKTGESTAELAEAYRKFAGGGEEAGQGGARLAKSFKELPGLLQAGQGGGRDAQMDALERNKARDPEERAAISASQQGQKRSTVDILKSMSRADLDKMMAKEYGPGGPSGGAAEKRGDLLVGEFQDLAASVERVKVAFAEGFAEDFKGALKQFSGLLPGLIKDARVMGVAFADCAKAVAGLISLIPGHSPRQNEIDEHRKYNIAPENEHPLATQQRLMDAAFGDKRRNEVRNDPLYAMSAYAQGDISRDEEKRLLQEISRNTGKPVIVQGVGFDVQ